MTCLTFPFGEASWQPVAVVVADDAALAPIVSAAALFVAPAAATVSRHPSASAQRTPILLRLSMWSLPLGRGTRANYSPCARKAMIVLRSFGVGAAESAP